MIVPIWNFFRDFFAMPSDDESVENTYAYKAGGKAYYANDIFNPYRDGTDSHANWNSGYDAAEQWEASIW